MTDDNLKTTPEEKDEYSYKDVHEETPKEIIENKTIPEEKPVEKPEEKKEEKPEEKEEVLDTEKLAEQVAEKVAEKVKPVEEVKTKTEEEEYLDWATKFKEEKGKEPSWTDVASHLKEEAIKAIDERNELKQKQVDEERKVKEENERKQTENFNKIVDEDLDDLYSSKKLTPIVDKNNPSDQGVIERKALFQKMLEVNQARTVEGKRPIYSIKEIYYEHYQKPNAQPAGEEAPISLGRGTSPQGEDEKEIDYIKDVRNSSWGTIRNLLSKK